jgi:hypothetical protein
MVPPLEVPQMLVLLIEALSILMTTKSWPIFIQNSRGERLTPNIRHGTVVKSLHLLSTGVNKSKRMTVQSSVHGTTNQKLKADFDPTLGYGLDDRGFDSR